MASLPRVVAAKDWKSNLAVALDHSGAQHRLQFHHIFPKALQKSTSAQRDADAIANLAFIGGKTNHAISDKPPAGTAGFSVHPLGDSTEPCHRLVKTDYFDFLTDVAAELPRHER